MVSETVQDALLKTLKLIHLNKCSFSIPGKAVHPDRCLFPISWALLRLYFRPAKAAFMPWWLISGLWCWTSFHFIVFWTFWPSGSSKERAFPTKLECRGNGKSCRNPSWQHQRFRNPCFEEIEERLMFFSTSANRYLGFLASCGFTPSRKRWKLRRRRGFSTFLYFLQKQQTGRFIMPSVLTDFVSGFFS